MDKLISEWVSIQNIAVEKPFNKMMVEELGEDICGFFGVDRCEKAREYCVVKNNQCVSASRLKKMHTQKTLIVSKNTGEKFEVIYSQNLDKVESLLAAIEMYYVSVRSIKTGHVYVLFSSGIVLKESDFVGNPKVENGLIDLMMVLKRYVLKHRNKKIVFGGHSMGAILALYAGYLFKKHDQELFRSNVAVVGTGLAKSVTDDMMREMANLENVKMFISGEVRPGKKGARLLYDCLRDKGDLNMYAPIHYIYKELLDEDDYESSVFKVTPQSELTYTLDVGNENQCKKIHMWSFYASLLEKIYNYKQFHSLRPYKTNTRPRSRSKRTTLRKPSSRTRTRSRSISKRSYSRKNYKSYTNNSVKKQSITIPTV